MSNTRNSLDVAVGDWALHARSFIDDWLSQVPPNRGQDRNEWFLPRLIWSVIGSAISSVIVPPVGVANWKSLSDVQLKDVELTKREITSWLGDEGSRNRSVFRNICRLVPEMHILVRSGWEKPLRWVFLPLSAVSIYQDNDDNVNRARIGAGLILMVEDSTSSSPYQSSVRQTPSGRRSVNEDTILARLETLLPVLSTIAFLEASCLQEQVLSRFLAWEANRDRFSQVDHFLRDVASELDKHGESGRKIKALVELLSQQFHAQLLPPDLSERRKSVVIGGRKAAERAVRLFNETFLSERTSEATLSYMEETEFPLNIIPFEETYSEEDQLCVQAENALVFLLLDLLVQRSPHQHGEPLVLYVKRSDKAQQVSFEVRTQYQIGIETWHYPNDELTTLPRGRGFHNFFATAVALGCIDARVQDLSDSGLISVTFGEGKRD